MFLKLKSNFTGSKKKKNILTFFWKKYLEVWGDCGQDFYQAIASGSPSKKDPYETGVKSKKSEFFCADFFFVHMERADVPPKMSLNGDRKRLSQFLNY